MSEPEVTEADRAAAVAFCRSRVHSGAVDSVEVIALAIAAGREQERAACEKAVAALPCDCRCGRNAVSAIAARGSKEG